jgi:3-oxoacyl-[acyl-carrier-protein] synthase II
MIVPRQRECRVVITGLGVISPIGNTLESFWESLVQRRSGVATLASASNDGPGPCAGEAREFTGHIDNFGPLEDGIKKAIRKGIKLMNRETQMAVAAAQHALGDSALMQHGPDPERIGVCFGAGFVSMLPEDFVAGVSTCTSGDAEFDFDRWGQEGLNQVAPLWLLKCLPNMPACHIAIYNDFRGPNNSITQRECAANLAIAEARNLIADGMADAMVVGATGTTLLAFNRLHTLMEEDVADSTGDPASACRPFDRTRTGAVIAEGAGAIVVERLECALDRGAQIYGEIVGAGSSCVVDRSYVPRCDRALANAMRMALRGARMSPDAIGHIHAHGLGTQRSDRYEAKAIRDVFGKRSEQIPLVAAKSYMGNAGAGCGAIELVASLLALKHGTLFPVLNYREPDPDCPVAPVQNDDVAAGESFVNLSMLPQGQASCVVIRNFNE